MATLIQSPSAPALARAAELPKPLIGSALLFSADLLSLSGAIGLAVSAWAIIVRAPIEVTVPHFIVIATALIAYAARNLYDPFGLTQTEQLRTIVGTTTLVYLTMSVGLFLSKQSTTQSRGVFLCCWALSIILVPLLRAIVVAYASPCSWWGHPAILVGGGSTAAEELLHLFRNHPALGIRPVAVVDDGGVSHIAGVPVLADMDTAEAHAQRLGIYHAVVVEPGANSQALLDRCAAQFANVLVIPQIGAQTSLWISPKDLGGTLGLEVRHNLLVPLNRVLKRALDLVVALSSGILAIPIIAVSAIWIFCVSRGSPFFSQRRQSAQCGFFHVYKLRTMYPDAEMMLLQYLQHSSDATAEWQRDFKLKDDPRVLPGIGKLLRRTSLDELPQLWNVLKGEMSVVGPRPIVAAEVERYGSSFDIVKRVKPGLTGLWQVSGRNDVSYAERVRLDAYYVRNWSIWLDITILARTALVLLFRQGAY
jgi:Undecaprenyl-phosphate galactose phosphotransferase WbaP